MLISYFKLVSFFSFCASGCYCKKNHLGTGLNWKNVLGMLNGCIICKISFVQSDSSN